MKAEVCPLCGAAEGGNWKLNWERDGRGPVMFVCAPCYISRLREAAANVIKTADRVAATGWADMTRVLVEYIPDQFREFGIRPDEGTVYATNPLYDPNWDVEGPF